MRGWIIAVAAAGMLAACGQQQKAEAPADTAAVETPAPAFAPMSAERTALCSAALDAWKGMGAAKPPGDMTVAEFGESAPLLGLRGMELELADAEGFKAAKASADTAWKDKTPADIEAATVACLDEIDP
jgi:hypothetical protein